MKFGSSGIRGIANQAITSESALRIGRAVGAGYNNIVVGHDTRVTAEMIEYGVISGLLSMGCRVTRVGMVATPTLAHAARDYDCGIMVTASHNPPEYIGVKLFNPDGMAFDSGQQKTTERAIDDEHPRLASWDKIRQVRRDENAVADHISTILSGVGIAEGKRISVVVDCGCGAASLTTPYLLREMGCDVITLNCQPDGFFPGRSSEPKDESLTALKSVVVSAGADLGIAHDGDADRMVAVDDRGRFVSNDKLLAFFGKHEAKRSIVVPVDASMLIDAVLPDVKITRTRVGDVFVSEEIKRQNADFGGEPSGTWVFPKISYCPEAIYAAARLVEILSRGGGDSGGSGSGRDASERWSDQLDLMPEYEIKRGSIPYHGEMAQIEEELRSLEFLEIGTIDGIRLTFEDSWALVRASGTEPLIRITVEGETALAVSGLYQKINRIIAGVIA